MTNTILFVFEPSFSAHRGETSLAMMAGTSRDGHPIEGPVIATFDTPRLAAEAALRLADETGATIWLPGRDEMSLTEHGAPGSPLEKPSALQAALFARRAEGSEW